MTRTKKILITLLIIATIIAAIWLICQFVFPLLFTVFKWALQKIIAPIIVIVIIIILGFMAMNN